MPGPFEYDVKRMAASFTIAGRNNGFAQADMQLRDMVGSVDIEAMVPLGLTSCARDHQEFVNAVKSGRLKAVEGV